MVLRRLFANSTGIATVSATGAIIAGWLTVAIIAPRLDQVLEIAVSKDGGQFNAIVIYFGILLLPLTVFVVIRAPLCDLLGFYIILLPAMYRFRGFASITAHWKAPSPPQLVSITTFVLFGLLVLAVLRGLTLEAVHGKARYAEGMLWGFAVLGTISQFVNHAPWSAFWLSLGGLWEFVALFYIVRMSVHNEGDVRHLLKALVISLLVGIAFRMGTFGVGFVFETDAGGYQRIGGSAFGPAVSYGGYLAFGAVLALYLVQSAGGVLEKTAWIAATVLLLWEMVNTHTRGAMLSFLFVGLLLAWPRERRSIISLTGMGVIFLLASGLWDEFLYLSSQRGFSLTPTLLQTENFISRTELWRNSLEHVLDNYGLGYGIGNPLYVTTSTGLATVSHNMVLELTQAVGLFATLFFVAIFGLTLIRSLRACTASRLMRYLFVALIAWFVFANTTSTSIVYYYPYEATILMYLVLFSSLVVGFNDTTSTE